MKQMPLKVKKIKIKVNNNKFIRAILQNKYNNLVELNKNKEA